jgi:KaiC/GvpD/RAD55 family RecA-like ATPase
MDSTVFKKLKKSLDRNKQLLLLVTSEKKYTETVENISHAVSKIYEKICFITLNKSHKSVAEAFRQKKIDVGNFFFIDAVTKEADQKSNGVAYVSSLDQLTELEIEINKVLHKGKAECFIFDSMSTMLIYDSEMNVIRFVHNIITLLRARNLAGVFITLKKDTKTNVIKDMNMFIDDVINV